MTKPRRMTRHRAEKGCGLHYTDLTASARSNVRLWTGVLGHVNRGLCDRCRMPAVCADACRYCRGGRGEPFPDVPLWSGVQPYPAPFPKGRDKTDSARVKHAPDSADTTAQSIA